MSKNELVLLDQVLQQRQTDRDVPLEDDKAFELFASEQALRDQDLSIDEVAQAIVGGGNDGAMDSVYVFVEDQLLSEDSEIFEDNFNPASVPSGSVLKLWMVQAKREESFTETAIDKVAQSTKRLLDLSEDPADLAQLYSPAVVTRTGLFRSALKKLATRHPAVKIRFDYATRGQTDEINTKVEIKARDLVNQLCSVLPGAEADVGFLGAAEFWRRVDATPSYTLELTYQENATSGTSHVALVKLRDYLDFLTDEKGELRRHIFDWNVRDYQGSVEVNQEIRASLESEDAPEFWWLNNGVTIVCSKTSIVSRTYVLDDVQIVNGLQTSHTIHSVLRSAPDDSAVLHRAILVRILVTGDDPVVRDQVIRATNRQTTVTAASLRATDEVQRSIEKFFLAEGWFYDRRKNLYRNLGKSPERIVGIPLLAQAVMAMGLSRPDDSRARPSSLLKRDNDYNKIFAADLPLEVYLWLAVSQKRVDGFLASGEAGVTAQERTNLRFHLAMLAATKLVGQRIYAPAQLKGIVSDGRAIEEADLPALLTDLRVAVGAFAAESGDSDDKIAKGSEFVERLITPPDSQAEGD